MSTTEESTAKSLSRRCDSDVAAVATLVRMGGIAIAWADAIFTVSAQASVIPCGVAWFDWAFVEVPEESKMVNASLFAGSAMQSMAVDAAGVYEMSVVVTVDESLSDEARLRFEVR
ncbi:MAG: hypothetical protein AB8H79_11245 [Myxococcota bacterium]